MTVICFDPSKSHLCTSPVPHALSHPVDPVLLHSGGQHRGRIIHSETKILSWSMEPSVVKFTGATSDRVVYNVASLFCANWHLLVHKSEKPPSSPTLRSCYQQSDWPKPSEGDIQYSLLTICAKCLTIPRSAGITERDWMRWTDAKQRKQITAQEEETIKGLIYCYRDAAHGDNSLSQHHWHPSAFEYKWVSQHCSEPSEPIIQCMSDPVFNSDTGTSFQTLHRKNVRFLKNFVIIRLFILIYKWSFNWSFSFCFNYHFLKRTWHNLPRGEFWMWAKHYFISRDNISLVIEIYRSRIPAGWN